MKKKGFSLAEVLITLTIIGVIAALSIPQFTADVHNQSNAAKLAPVVADFENVFGMMLLREDVENIFETNFGGANNLNAFTTGLENYTKIARTGTALATFGYDSGISDINGGSATDPPLQYAVATTGGAVLTFGSRTGNAPNQYKIVHIDVNGSTAPNRLGRDIYAFLLSQDGHLCPYGSRQAGSILAPNNANAYLWNSSSFTEHSCSGTGYTGRGCTARLIENNYKSDY